MLEVALSLVAVSLLIGGIYLQLQGGKTTSRQAQGASGIVPESRAREWMQAWEVIAEPTILKGGGDGGATILVDPADQPAAQGLQAGEAEIIDCADLDAAGVFCCVVGASVEVR